MGFTFTGKQTSAPCATNVSGSIETAQSKTMSWLECGVSTLITGTAATVANYFLLPIFWTLPPTPAGSLTMAAFFGGMGWILKYPIRRFFNAIR